MFVTGHGPSWPRPRVPVAIHRIWSPSSTNLAFFGASTAGGLLSCSAQPHNCKSR